MLQPYKAKSSGPDLGEGVTYLYVGDKRLRSNYGVDARFTSLPGRRQGWHDTSIRLGPLKEDDGWVQIGLGRWERFDYRAHVTVAWSVPHGQVEYRDTALMLSDHIPHRLGIYVKDGLVQLVADGHAVCSTSASYFVSETAPKYFQVRAETGVVGSNGDARVSNLRLKRDNDAAPIPYASDCVLHRLGIFWEPVPGGAFATRGAFYPTETTFFTGLDPERPCRS